jgi:hypothetical protein
MISKRSHLAGLQRRRPTTEPVSQNRRKREDEPFTSDYRHVSSVIKSVAALE